ncbi:MAG TPA: hypothetical protein DIT13_18700, partial [Verrucomicrobiales bacterium]|nr:hypothetical protein [Verrucomicrobiales bacterium]
LWQNDRNYAVHIIHRWPDDALKVSTAKPTVRPGVWQHVFVTYDGSGKAEGVKIYIDGEAQPLKTEVNALKNTIRTATPTRIGQRSHVQVFHEGSVQDVRIYERLLRPAEIQTLAKVGPLREMLASAKRGPKQVDALFAHYLATRHQGWIAADKTHKALEAEQAAIKNRSPMTHVQEEKMDSQPMANILMRGQYDQVGEQVPAEVP